MEHKMEGVEQRIKAKKLSIKQMKAFRGPIIFVLFVICVAISKNPDSDMWWMMATGREILQNKALPTTNPFVIHEGFTIIVQQWFLAIVNYLVYSNWGRIGLIVFALCIFAINVFLLNIYISCFTEDIREKRILTYIVAIICSFYLNTRPTQFTIMILLLEQIAVLKYKEKNKKQWLWLLPVLSVVEINIHGSFWIFLFVMLLPHVVPDIRKVKGNVRAQIKSKRDYVLPVMVSMVAGLLNPNGMDTVAYLLKSYNSTKLFTTINELKSPMIWSWTGFFFSIAIVVLVVYIFRIHEEDFDIANAYMGMGVVILAAKHSRNIWFLIFLIIPMGKFLLKMIYEKFIDCNEGRQQEKRIGAVKRALANSFYILVICGLVFSIVYIPDSSKRYIPQEAVDYLSKFEKEEIRLCATFNTGGYMEWMGYKVYIDARPELFTQAINGVANVADEYYDVVYGTIDYTEFLDKYDFTHIIADARGSFNTFLKYSSGYHQVNDDGNYVLYEK